MAAVDLFFESSLSGESDASVILDRLFRHEYNVYEIPPFGAHMLGTIWCGRGPIEPEGELIHSPRLANAIRIKVETSTLTHQVKFSHAELEAFHLPALRATSYIQAEGGGEYFSPQAPTSDDGLITAHHFLSEYLECVGYDYHLEASRHSRGCQRRQSARRRHTICWPCAVRSPEGTAPRHRHMVTGTSGAMRPSPQPMHGAVPSTGPARR